MSELRLGAVESRFADLIWREQPLSTSRLVELCAQQLNWKRTTTYTVLKRLCERGIFQTQDGVVTELISRTDFYAMQSERFVDETFEGSLPAFLAAFSKRKPLSPEEIAQLRRMIDSYEEG
ncbi:MAG: BlaI/MecI/CopY family transcriptional regulator [Clostridia bacterium]|nr:BlaI/MecI/CopY family transcriptional regulator [Clostridia bacterium]